MHDSLIETILLTLQRYSMLASGEKVLCAVSGGPDSVALLHALWSLRDELGISPYVAHMNHSFRGAESDADARYVCDLAANLGLECVVEKVDVPAIQRALRLSPEEAARMVRYEFLERVSEEIGAHRVAFGHTADDQVETVLLNLLRGTGVDGLSGMPAVRGKIIRPLIEIRRSDVEAYVEANHLHPRLDATNLMATYTRNRIRLDLLPMLRREYNSDIDGAILRLAELAREDTAYLSMEAREALSRITVAREENSISLDPERFQSYVLAIRRRVIREAVREVRGELADVGFIHIEELVRLLDTGTDFEYELPGGTYVRRTPSALIVLSSRPDEVPIIYCYELAVPGETIIPEIDAGIEAEVTSTRVEHIRMRGSMEVVLDNGAILGKLRVRNWEPGDRIRPLGLRGSKKIQDLFVDGKIPREVRHRAPLIVDDEKVLWVVGLAVSEDSKVTGNTREFLLLKVQASPTCPLASCVI